MKFREDASAWAGHPLFLTVFVAKKLLYFLSSICGSNPPVFSCIIYDRSQKWENISLSRVYAALSPMVIVLNYI